MDGVCEGVLVFRGDCYLTAMGNNNTHSHTLPDFFFGVKVNGQVQVYFLEKQQRTKIKLPEKNKK